MSTNRSYSSRYMPGTRLIEGVETGETIIKNQEAEEFVSSNINCDVLTCSSIEVDESILCNGILDAVKSSIGELSLGDIVVTDNILSVNPEEQDTLILQTDNIRNGEGSIEIKGNVKMSNPSAISNSDLNSSLIIEFDNITATGQTTINGDLNVSGTITNFDSLDVVLKDNILSLSNNIESTYTANSYKTRGVLFSLEGPGSTNRIKSVGMFYSTTNTNNTLLDNRISLSHSDNDGKKAGGEAVPDGQTSSVNFIDYVGLNVKDINLFTDTGSNQGSEIISVNLSDNSKFQNLTFKTGIGDNNFGSFIVEGSKLKLSHQDSNNVELEIYSDANINSYKNLIFKTFDSSNTTGYIKFDKTSINIDNSSSFNNSVDIEVNDNKNLILKTKNTTSGNIAYLKFSGPEIFFLTRNNNNFGNTLDYGTSAKIYLSTNIEEEGYINIDSFSNTTDVNTKGTYQFKGKDLYINNSLIFNKATTNQDTFESGVEISSKYTENTKKSIIFTSYGDYQEDISNQKHQKIVMRGNMIQFSNNEGLFPADEDNDNSEKRVIIRHGTEEGLIVLGHNVRILGTLENSGDLSVDGNFAVNGFRAASLNTKSVTIEDENIQINFVDVTLIDSVDTTTKIFTGVYVADETDMLTLSYDAPYKTNDLIYIQYSNILRSYLESETETVIQNSGQDINFSYSYDSSEDTIVAANPGGTWSYDPRVLTPLSGIFRFLKNGIGTETNVWICNQNHNLNVNDVINFTSGSFSDATQNNYLLNIDYHVIKVINNTTFQLSDTYGGALLTSNENLTNWSASKLSYNYKWTSSSNHGLSVNDTVKFDSIGTGPTTYNTTDYFYVIEVPSTTEIKLASSLSGNVLTDNIKSVGTWTLNKHLGEYVWSSTEDPSLDLNNILKIVTISVSGGTSFTKYNTTNKYYVVNKDSYIDTSVTPNITYYTFKLSNSLGGNIIDEQNVLTDSNGDAVTTKINKVIQLYSMKNIDGIQRIKSVEPYGKKIRIKLCEDVNDSGSSSMSFRRDVISGIGNRIFLKTLCGFNCILAKGKIKNGETGFQIPFSNPVSYQEGSDLEGLSIFGEYGSATENSRFRIQIFMEDNIKKFRISTRISFFKKDTQIIDKTQVNQYFDFNFTSSSNLLKLPDVNGTVPSDYGVGILSSYDSSAKANGFEFYNQIPVFNGTQNALTADQNTNTLTTTGNAFSVFSDANTKTSYEITGANGEVLLVTGYTNDNTITVKLKNTADPAQINWYNNGLGFAFTWQDTDNIKKIFAKFTKKAEQYPVGFYWNFDGIAINTVSGDIGMIMNYDNINNAGVDVVGFDNTKKPSDFDNFFIKKFLRLQNYQTSIISSVNNTNWLSSEHFNLEENKDYKINNRKLLSLENNDQMNISQSTKVKPNNNGIISGTLASTASSLTVIGTNSKFISEFKTGDIFIVDGVTNQYIIDFIESDTILYLNATNPTSFNSKTAYKIIGRNNSGSFPKFSISSSDQLESTAIPISGDVTVPNIVTQDIGDDWTYNGTTGLWTFSSTTSLPSLDDTIKFNSNGGGTTVYNINTTYYVIDLDSTNRTLKLSLEKGGYPVVDTTSSTGNWKANKVDLYLTGNNTKFTDELKIGDFLRLGTVDIEIKNIVNDTLLEVKNSFDTVGLYNSPEMKFNLNNEFEIGDCITLIKASDGNVVNVTDSSGLTIKVYVISISSDHKVILNNGIDANDYLICRQPKTFSIFKKDSASSIISVDANNNTIGINTESATGLLEINQSGSSEKVALKINANEDDIDAVDITADSLTTGSALNISSDSSSTSARNLVKIVNDNTLATNTTLLYLKNDAIPSQAAVTFESTTVNTDQPILELKNSNTSPSNYSVLDFNRSDTTNVANNMGLGRINFKNDSTSFCRIRTLAQDVTGATSSGAMIFDIRTSNSTSRFLSLEGGITSSSDCQVVINDDGIDCNFRVESINNLHMLFVDAGNNKVGIGVADPDSLLEVYGTTTQQKWSYDDNNFSSITVDSSSNTTIAVGQSGNLTFDAPGDINLDAAGNDYIFNPGGTESLKITANGTTDVTFDAPGNMKFDAAGNDYIFNPGGTDELKFSNSSGSWTIQPQTTDKDLILRSNGTGDLITHLTDDNADSKFIIKNDSNVERFVVDSEGKSKLTSGSTTDNAFEIDASQQNGNVLDITANSLTDGNALKITSSATSMTNNGGLLHVSHSGTSTNSGACEICKFETASTDNTTLVRFKAEELTTGQIVRIVGNKLTTGKGFIIDSSSTDLTTTGRLLFVNHTGNGTTTGILNEFKTTANDATTLLALTANSLTTGSIMKIEGSALTSGNALEISTANKAIKLKTDTSFSGNVDDNCSETYLLKGVQGAGDTKKDFTIALDDSSTYFIRSFIVGRYKSSSGSIESATYTLDGYLERDGVNLTIDYTLNTIKETDTSWDIELQNSNGNLIIRCKGTENSTRWLVKLELVKITF